MQGVWCGYLFNELGVSMLGVIGFFVLQDEVVRVLVEKVFFGCMMYLDYCCIGGKMVNQWLEQFDGMVIFLVEMEKVKWIMCGKLVEESCFWWLIDVVGGQMFGVFEGYEKQVICEWIEDGWNDGCCQLSFCVLVCGCENVVVEVFVVLVVVLGEVDFDVLVVELVLGWYYFVFGLEVMWCYSECYWCVCVV